MSLGQKQPMVMAGRTFFSKPALSAGHRENYNKPMEDLFFGSRTPKACIDGSQASFRVRKAASTSGKLERIRPATISSMS